MLTILIYIFIKWTLIIILAINIYYVFMSLYKIIIDINKYGAIPKVLDMTYKLGFFLIILLGSIYI